MSYDLDVERLLTAITELDAKRVLVQLPDGLKPEAERIQRAVSKQHPTTELFFWSGSAFGSCDLPLHVERLGFDLLVHFGHAPWR